MTEQNTIQAYQDTPIDIKHKLAALWAVVMFAYIRGDLLGFYETGMIEDIIGGEVAGFEINSTFMVGTAVLMTLPSLMVFFSLVLKPIWNRWSNIIFGVLYTLVMLATMLMPGAVSWYLFLGVVEIIITVSIVWLAWTWPKAAPKTGAAAT